MKEQFKQIPDFPKYEISNLGRVKSLYTGKFMSLNLRDGYYGVVLTKTENGIRKQWRKSIHRLVAESFIPNPENLPCINHKDENKLNNNIENLEWCSHQYNNTYNGRAKKIGEKLKGKVPWNKGKTNIFSKDSLEKISKAMKGKPFRGNQYVKINYARVAQ